MFALRLKELREQKGLSQYSLAAALQCPQSTIGNWEAGKRETNFATLDKLANYFGVSVDYLLGREPKPPTESERAGGVSDSATVELTTTEEDTLLSLYRELGEKRGAIAQQAILTVIENMLQ